MRSLLGTVCIIGVGLIGGSLARAIKQHGLADKIIGAGIHENQLERAVQLGVIDDYSLDMAHAASQADLIVISVPVGAIEQIMASIKSAINANTIITDVGSSKLGVIESAQKVFGTLPKGLIPGHPIAGTEKSGVEASFAELYNKRCVILTPHSNSDAQALAKVRSMWEQVGAQVVEMTAEHHDEVLAATSHLPHVLAYLLVDTLAQMQEHSEIFKYAAGGFRDFTRIASSDPTMWRDICVANASAILKMIAAFSAELEKFSEAVAQHDSEQIEIIFRRAKNARDQHVIL